MVPDFVQAQADELDGISLYWPRTAIVEILPPAGFVSGLVVDHNAGTRKVKVDDDGEESEVEIGHEYYPVLARVLLPYKCREIRTGDVVRFTAMNYEDFPSPETRVYGVMHERCMLAVIEGFDEASFFPEVAA